MPLQLPNLDDRRYADLVEEARRLIPIYAPEWTNHNPSDPGIALVELFAYLTELLLYRLDRVTAANQEKFLKLLNGPDWTPSGDLTVDTRTTVLALRARERAVTAADFERLATEHFNQWLVAMQRAERDGELLDEWWQVTRLDPSEAAHLPSAVPAVARAICVPSRNLDRGTETARAESAPAHVSLIVLPEGGMRQPSVPQKAALWGYFDARRTLTLRHHVVGPYYAPIRAEIVIAAVSGTLSTGVRDRVLDQLARFLDPLSGGPAQTGWSFGRAVYVSELYEQMEMVEGVDYVTDLMLFSECLPADEQCAAAAPLWHLEGDLVGLALAQHHLPLPRIDPQAIVAAPGTRFVAVQLTVKLTPAVADDEAARKRQVKAVVRQFFHPRYCTLKQLTPTRTGLWRSDLQTALAEIPGVTDVELAWYADADRLHLENDQIAGLYVNADEVIHWQVQPEVEAT